ncbi:hypothetical protein VTK56DRAFT_3984 [Thermocarpiscus australiensis]
MTRYSTTRSPSGCALLPAAHLGPLAIAKKEKKTTPLLTTLPNTRQYQTKSNATRPAIGVDGAGLGVPRLAYFRAERNPKANPASREAAKPAAQARQSFRFHPARSQRSGHRAEGLPPYASSLLLLPLPTPALLSSSASASPTFPGLVPRL